MRLLTVSVVFGLLVSGLSIDFSTFLSTTQFNSTPADRITVSNRGRTTTYRGSGRREILALPLPLSLPHLG